MHQNLHTKFVGLCVALLLFAFTLMSVDRPFPSTKFRSVNRRSSISNDKVTDESQATSKESKHLSTALFSSNTTVGLVDYCAGDSYATLKPLIDANRQAYASRYNYTIFSGDLDTFPLQSFVEPLAWLKAAYFYHLLSSTHSQHFDWFLWVDCDALITRFDFSVDTILNDLNTSPSHHIVMAQDPHSEFNSGVMFVRNTDWSRDLWKRTLQMASNETVRRHPLWEQQALLELYRANQFNEQTRVLITPDRYKINAFRTPRRNDFNESSIAWHRVNCREQPLCNDLFEAMFCASMPKEFSTKELIDCANVNETLLEVF